MNYDHSDRRLLLIEYPVITGDHEFFGKKGEAPQVIVFRSPTERIGYIHGHLSGLDEESWGYVKYVAPGYWKDLLDAYGEEFSRDHIANYVVEDTDITEWLQGKAA